jgi:hypothetical protein
MYRFTLIHKCNVRALLAAQSRRQASEVGDSRLCCKGFGARSHEQRKRVAMGPVNMSYFLLALNIGAAIGNTKGRVGAGAALGAARTDRLDSRRARPK